MPLRLIYTADTTVPVELEGLSPDAVRGRSLDDIRRHVIFHGNEKISLGELFDVEGDTSDLEWHFAGDLAAVHWLGAGLRGGVIHVHGQVGRHLGHKMQGGRIVIDGDAGDWLGGEMRGGFIHVHGNAGHHIGAANWGSRIGMTGGTLLVDGDAGDEVARGMRRGCVALGGNCGNMPGHHMLAGSICVLGNTGIRAGAGMRRGTIALLGRQTPPLLPTFRYACRGPLLALQLMLTRLREFGLPVGLSCETTEVALYNGDFLEGGRGELLLRASA